MNNYTPAQLKRAISYWQTQLLIMEAVDSIVKTNMLFEDGDDVSQKITSYISKDIKSPKDIKKFIEKNKDKYEKSLDKLDDEKKPLYRKVWEYLCYAAGKSVKFIADNFLTILKLVAIVVLGWLAWPYLKKIKDFIESIYRDKERDEEEMKFIENQHKITKSNAQNSKSIVDIMLNDPAQLNSNLPEKFAKFSKEQIDFLSNLPQEKRELIQKWIFCNAKVDVDKNCLYGDNYVARKLGKFLEGGEGDPDEHVPSNAVVKGWTSGAKEYRHDLPAARLSRVISAVRGIKDSRGKHKFTPWNTLMKDIEDWDKGGQKDSTYFPLI